MNFNLPQQFQHIPDVDLYAHFSIQPIFSPWIGGEFSGVWNRISPYTLVSNDRAYSIKQYLEHALNLEGEVWECGVYHGGTAMLISEIAAGKTVRLFDTFEGMPESKPEHDTHRQGDFADTEIASVKERTNGAEIYAGFIPDTFASLKKSKICFSHIDVDIYQSVYDCCEFIFPRTVTGGIMLFDDCGFPSCAGARAAVDTYFADKKEKPIYLTTGQALIIKL